MGGLFNKEKRLFKAEKILISKSELINVTEPSEQKIWGEHKWKFYSSLFILFPAVLVIDGILYPDRELSGLYVIPLALAALAVENAASLLVISAFLSLVRYYISPMGLPYDKIELMFITWFAYFALSYLIKTLKDSYLTSKQSVLASTLALVNSLDSIDQYTAFHSRNVAMYAKAIAEKLKLPKKTCKNIYLGGILHDIGKIGIPHYILNKPSRLTAEELAIMKNHPLIGFNMAKHIADFQKNGVLDMILYHHERFDGKGYPEGLKEEEIPLTARIMAVADSFDAITSKRVYQNKKDLDYAIEEIRSNKGLQFDPQVADTFIELVEKGQIKVPSKQSSENK